MRYARPGVFASALLLLLAACASNGGNMPTSNYRSDETDAEKAASLNKQLGTVYLRQGNLALAKEKLERAEKYNPRDPETHSVLALLYEKLNEPAEVESHYKTAIRLAPHDPEIVNNYAVYLCKNGRTEEGVKRFLEAARNPLYRTPEMAYSNAGVCLRAAKRYDEAANAFARALQIRPGFAEAAFQSADLELERGRIAVGRAQLDRYLASHPATADLLLLGVRFARAQGDRVAEEKYTRRLRIEFAGSDQLRSLETKRNPG
ncbi:MAG TPA: type IV pilus biogenesis/stability protein PilW [Steroidobacteraceae bacterium]|nr:type IV pilus biogenesis/stability protein PilW [Steroidobacteraceae bacterium]